MGQYSAKISGAKIVVMQGSLSIDKRVEERSVAQFAVWDEDGSSHYEQGEAILIYDQDAALVFGGSIDVPEEQRVGEGLIHSIRCIDYHYNADKLIAADSWTDTAAGTIVEALRADYLNAEGITAGTIQAGPDIVSAIVNYVTVAKALDGIAAKSGFTWQIKPDKSLDFLDRSTNAAPWAVTSADMIKHKSRLQRGHRQYRNRQWVRGGKAATDPQVETKQGDAKADSFAVGYPIIQAPTVTVNAVGQTVGIKGIDTGKDVYWNKGDPVVWFDPGSTPGAVDVVISYVGEYNIIGLTYDEDGIAARLAIEGAGTGMVDDISEDHDASSIEAVFETGNAKLASFMVDGKKLRFETWRSGLEPGQLATVTYTPFGLAATEMLIEAVTIRPDGNLLRYYVTAVEGPVTGSWARYFSALTTGQLVVDKLTIGEETILIILVEADEAMDIADGSVTTVWACPVPDVTLEPDVGLVPC